MARIIEVLVNKRGETTIQTKGYAGSDCFQGSKYLEQALGIITGDRKIQEFFQEVATEQHVEQQ